MRKRRTMRWRVKDLLLLSAKLKTIEVLGVKVNKRKSEVISEPGV